RRLDRIVFAAHAHAAARDQQIGGGGRQFYRGEHGGRVVAHDRVPDHVAACLPGGGGEHVAVGIPDQTGYQGRTWLDELVSRRDDSCLRAAVGQDGAVAGRGEHADLGRA